MQKVRLLNQTLSYPPTQKNVEAKILEHYKKFNGLTRRGEPEQTERWKANKMQPFIDSCRGVMNVRAGRKWGPKPNKVDFNHESNSLP